MFAFHFSLYLLMLLMPLIIAADADATSFHYFSDAAALLLSATFAILRY